MRNGHTQSALWVALVLAGIASCSTGIADQGLDRILETEAELLAEMSIYDAAVCVGEADGAIEAGRELTDLGMAYCIEGSAESLTVTEDDPWFSYCKGFASMYHLITFADSLDEELEENADETGAFGDEIIEGTIDLSQRCFRADTSRNAKTDVIREIERRATFLIEVGTQRYVDEFAAAPVTLLDVATDGTFEVAR